MKFRRSHSTLVTDPELTPVPATEPSLSVDMNLRELSAFAHSYGFELLPAGAWEKAVGGLEARVAGLEAQLEQAKKLVANGFNSSWTEYQRAVRAESEASALAQVLVGGEIDALEHGDYNNDED